MPATIREATMHGTTENKRGLRAAFRSLLGALLASSPGIASSVSAPDEPPMVLAKTGYLFVGGKIDSSVPGSPMTGQMYVEYFIPKTLSHHLPIVMIHGGSQTGTNFTGTPDGREGWAQYFVRRGHAVYVVDQVARGRSAHFSLSQGKVADANLKRTEQRFTAPEKSNLWPQAKLHTQWPGAGQAGDPVFDQFYASQFPSLSSFPKQQELNTAAGIALFDKIGPAVLMIHSQSGTFIWPIADARPNLVKAVIAVEPNGPPVYETEFKGAPEWFADMGNKKLSGLGEMPLTYDPPLKAGEELAFVRQDKPDRPDLVRCWQQAEPARKLKNLAGIPMVIVMSEASYHASYDHCTANYLTQAGVRNTMIKLGEAGIHGNGHMMMLEKNSDDIARVMREWLMKAVPPKD
jgi:pimeloyl-ACP methyl ester carboxylesterase